MKIIVDFNDLTAMIITDLANKGIHITEDDIEYTENGAEIALNPKPVKPTKPKTTRNKKQDEVKEIPTETETETVVETKKVEVETETDDVFTDEDDEPFLEETTEEESDDDDSLFG